MWLLVAALLAQPPSPAVRDQAEQLFTRGEALFRAGDLSGAERAFTESYALLPLGATAWNLARCTEGLGQHARAIGWYRRYLRLEPQATDRKQVEASIRALEKRLTARGVQALTVFLLTPGARASVDGGEAAGDGATFELAPGARALEVSAPGFVTTRLEVVVPLSASQEVAITLTPAAPAALDPDFVLPATLAPAPRPPPPPPEVVLTPTPAPSTGPSVPDLIARPPAARPEHRLRYTWLGLGLTAGAGVTGLIAGLVATNASSQLQDGTLRTRDQNEALASTTQTGALVANVAWVTAAVLAVATAITLGVEW